LTALSARAETAAPQREDVEATPAEAPAESSPPAATPATSPGVELSLLQAVDAALVNNLDLALNRYIPEIAREQLEQAKGVYDPNFFASIGYRSSQTPEAIFFSTPTQIPVVNQRDVSGSSGLSGQIPILGAMYGITYVGSQSNSSTTGDPLFSPSLSPENNAHLEAVLSIPLLRDLIWNQSWTQIQSAELADKGTREEFRKAMMDTVLDTEGAYWNLIAAREKMRVNEKSLETSRALLEQTKAQYEVGTVSKVEVTEAEAGVAERELNLIIAVNAYRGAQDRLIDIVFGDRLTPASDLQIEPSDELGNAPEQAVDPAAAMETAMQYRPEIASAQYFIEQRNVELRFAKNQRLPRFDVEGHYAYDGLTGTTTTSPKVNFGDFNDAHDDFLSTAGPHTWSTRGTFSIPIGNRTASHRVTQSTIELRQAKTAMKRLEQSIVLEVRKAVRDLRSAEEGIRASDRRTAAARAQLNAAEIRLQYGDTTPFFVLQKESDLVDAESQQISAHQLYRDSLAAFQRAQGTILENYHIEVDSPKPVR